jgi:1-acyl-sn-glycerol-3-phosphate acyltransferase
MLYLAGISWCRGSLLLLRIICGIRYRVIGRENLPNTPYIIASKHESAFETIAFWDVFYIPTFILKHELTRIPLFGWYLKSMKMIAINRSSGASAIKKMLNETDRHLKMGRKVIVYPEGTRDKHANGVKYNPGIAALYKHSHVPVVPVALNSGSLWPYKGFAKYPGTIEVKILPPIHPGLDKERFMNKLVHSIESAFLIRSCSKHKFTK